MLSDVHEVADVGKVAEVVARVANSRVSVPPNRSGSRGCAQRARRQHQEGPIRFPLGHAARGRKMQRGGQQSSLSHRAWLEFGYNNLVVDMRSLAIMRKFAPVVFDATHSVQLPSAQADDGSPAVSGGQPEFIPVLARAAVAAGVDGVFLEVHDNPKVAKSDGANALESTKLRELLKELLAVRKALDVAHSTP